MARVLLFATNDSLALSRQQLQKLFIEDDYEGWLERRHKLVAVWGALNPEPYFDLRLGKLGEPTPPAVPPTPPEGPARESRDSLTLVHSYGEAEWQEVRKLHDEVWARFLEEDQKRTGPRARSQHRRFNSHGRGWGSNPAHGLTASEPEPMMAT